MFLEIDTLTTHVKCTTNERYVNTTTFITAKLLTYICHHYIAAGLLISGLVAIASANIQPFGLWYLALCLETFHSVIFMAAYRDNIYKFPSSKSAAFGS